jgi:hypothetical protein
MGIRNWAANDRLLDLLGVRYDFEHGGLTVRPNALPRLATFTHYRVAPSDVEQIRILKEPSFDPNVEVLISAPPTVAFAQSSPQRFRTVNFASRTTARLDAKLALDQPAVVLFNDRYSQDWHARWNGKDVPILLANGSFMAVPLPSSSGTLEFEFRPGLLLRMLPLSMACGALLMMLTSYAVITWLRSRPVAPKL